MRQLLKELSRKCTKSFVFLRIFTATELKAVLAALLVTPAVNRYVQPATRIAAALATRATAAVTDAEKLLDL